MSDEFLKKFGKNSEIRNRSFWKLILVTVIWSCFFEIGLTSPLLFGQCQQIYCFFFIDVTPNGHGYEILYETQTLSVSTLTT